MVTKCLQLMKYSLTTEKLQSYVPIMFNEIRKYFEQTECFRDNEGIFDVVENIAPLTLFTASATLQGREVRQKFDGELSELYHDLDKSFIPINFYMPGLPIPVNRNRDKAHKKIAAIYKNIIDARHVTGLERHEGEDDMIWSLMRSTYKDGTSVPDHEIAHMMIGILMAGQHNTYSVSSWILFRLSMRPDIQEELYQEQLENLGPDFEISATKDAMDRLPLHKTVAQETLRLHAPIHTVMRAVKSTLEITTQNRTCNIPSSHVLVSAPGISAKSEMLFPEPDRWEPHRWDSITDLQETRKETVRRSLIFYLGLVDIVVWERHLRIFS